MATQTSSRLSQEQLARYRRDGYLLLPGAVPRTLLEEGQRLLEPWVDYFIDKWAREGLLEDASGLDQLDFGHRFLEAWRRGGKPHFRRSPNRFLINEGMYRFLRSPVFLDIAEQLLGTPDISVHGIFNGRPQLPDHPETCTPVHQDAQFWQLDYGAPEPDIERRTHVVTMWMPLQPVDAASGCLEVISLEEVGDRVFDLYDYDFERTGFYGLSPDDLSRHRLIPIEMVPGDLLAFSQRSPHGSTPNKSDHIRWSIDIRYEATATATVFGRKYGFVARSASDPGAVTPLEAWLEKGEPR